ncbi:Phage integrase family protein [Thiohalospira halophila DSM 15071]|uniref:Phage integrase family protein n=1 Tax=Thiohalospira halophila DSM 15071 TaxID=1123397 RepID=A0A1I1WN87_9GAMM|nr:tyrosine-type recombinase/integrase [Thiohalospira halophila]SFD95848.1 Phage integrase family protein [Thiohalospira halophila DSM 15071]
MNWVGDDRVLRLEAMGAIVEKARERLLGAVDRGDPYERHNAMATYTGLGLALATGFRTVRTPIVDLTAIHAETRTLCLQEKDRWDGQDARLVPLPEAVYDQVGEYLRHLRQLWTQLPAARSAVLPIPATKARDQRVYGHEAFDLVLNRSLFFFEQSEEGHHKPVELTGDRLQRELNALVPGYWPIPNAGRHALRSWLIRHGAEANLVNALMGHAYYGEEHWAPTSALDPVAYRGGILPYLEQLTQTLGYRVVRS